MTKITSLTPKQEIELREFHDEMMRYGTCTEPADRRVAEQSICAMYARMKLEQPSFIWFDSPATYAIGRWLMQQLSKDDALRSSLESSLRSSLESSLWSSLESSLGSSLESSLWSSLGSSLESSLWSSLGSSLRSSLRSSLGSSLGNCFWGQHELYWPAFYEFCARVGVPYKPEDHEALQWWFNLGRSCGWWAPYQKLVCCCERPLICRIDDRRVLHSEEGPAMKFRDGWSVCAVHGVRLPDEHGEQIIMRPETQTIEQIEKEDNQEVKRIRIERFGWDNYIAICGAVPVDVRCNERDQQQEELFALKDGSKRVRVIDPSTGRRYVLGVPREINTCEQAQNWMSHGLDRLAIHRS
jgi:hypothetical protein